MQNVFITGGAGFLGSHLAETLVARGHRVTVLDDLSTGQRSNVEHLLADPRFQLIVGSVLDGTQIEDGIRDADVVFHLAAAVGVHLIVEQPVRTIETNTAGTERVLAACARHRTPVLIASTSEVYGKSKRRLFHEDDDLVIGPTSRSRWCYASSKILDECLAQAYYKEQGLPAVVTRFFNTIGPRQTGRYGMVVPRFIDQALRDEPITVYGDGSQQRSFTWVGDVVEAIVALMSKPSAMGEVFNIGHHKETTILDLAHTIREMTGSRSKISFLPHEDALGRGFDDVERRMPDLTKIHSCIGYEPSRKLRGMLAAIIEHRRAKAGSRT